MKRSKEGRKSQEEGSRVSEKELIRRLGEELDVRLKKARREGNLVIKDALEDEKTIRDVFDEGEGVFRLFPAFVPRRFGKAGRRLRLHPDITLLSGWQGGPSPSDGFPPRWQPRTGSLQRQMRECRMSA